MIKKTIVAVVTSIVLATGGSVVITPPTASASDHFVTRAEYHKVKRGWRMTRVHRVFGTNGRRDRLACPWAWCHLREYDSRPKLDDLIVVQYVNRNGVWRLYRKAWSR